MNGSNVESKCFGLAEGHVKFSKFLVKIMKGRTAFCNGSEYQSVVYRSDKSTEVEQQT